MILTPDSSAQATMATSPAPESPISSISSHGSRASSVSRMSCVSQGMSSPYHVAQLPHHLSPNMPTMDSTVSSAKPEPELNIGTSRKKIELSVNVHKRKKKNIFLYYPFLLPNFTLYFRKETELENYEISIRFEILENIIQGGPLVSYLKWYRKGKKKKKRSRVVTVEWKQKVVTRRCCNPPRERRKCSSFSPTFLLSDTRSPSPRGEQREHWHIDNTRICIVWTVCNPIFFFFYLQNSTVLRCCVAFAGTRRPVFTMEYTPARDARWVEIRALATRDTPSLTSFFDPFTNFRLRSSSYQSHFRVSYIYTYIENRVGEYFFTRGLVEIFDTFSLSLV